MAMYHSLNQSLVPGQLFNAVGQLSACGSVLESSTIHINGAATQLADC